MGRCKYVPSPGDTTENGCGLLPVNEFAVWFYPRWKTFGQSAFQLVDVNFTPTEAEAFMEKLFVIGQYAPSITESKQKRAESTVPKKRR